ncbi:MAG: hypothetical protein PHN84_07610 [Desulfuromonadaceae bacterium]|nr:hypothetical protein [Desulfuromonadaceae bacterium]MDD2855760.1 hypothetical protein [Desulfuromonadaceae bacterium]
MSKFTIISRRNHSKASERYVDVTFNYASLRWETSVPIEYRRTGIDLSDDQEVTEYIEKVYEQCHPDNWEKWRLEQKEYWESRNAETTASIFMPLLTFEWTCQGCKLPQNPNFARRVQDLKECGYTVATYPAKYCSNCNTNKTHLLLLPLARGGVSGYETWSPQLRARMISTLRSYDAYEGKTTPPHSLLPDHKFPEIRWDENTRRESLELLTDADITKEFQLLTNQRNQQKREVCRRCFQSGERGYPFGVKFYYTGDSSWSQDIPSRGKTAEKGCYGCGWYDLEAWRHALNKILG